MIDEFLQKLLENFNKMEPNLSYVLPSKYNIFLKDRTPGFVELKVSKVESCLFIYYVYYSSLSFGGNVSPTSTSIKIPVFHLLNTPENPMVKLIKLFNLDSWGITGVPKHIPIVSLFSLASGVIKTIHTDQALTVDIEKTEFDLNDFL